MNLAEEITRAKTDYDEVYEAGKQAEREEYINRLNANGARTNYSSAFLSQDWTGYEFKEGEVVPTRSVNQMFYDYRGTTLPKGIRCEFEESLIPLINSRHSQLYNYAQNLVEVYDINLPVVQDLYSMFTNCYKLKKIEIVRVMETTIIGNAFGRCDSLEDITIEGVIGENFDIRYSPLTRESMMGKEITSDVYNALSETVQTNNVYVKNGKYYYGGVITALSPTVSGKTVYFKATAKTAAFTDAEWSELIATKPNWTFTLV